MDSVKQDQVGVILKHPPFSPLSLWERARVRAVQFWIQQSTPKSLNI
jgi:hypothetical protein